MKKLTLLLVLGLLVAAGGPALAKVERLEIQNPEKNAQRGAAEARIKNIDLQDIEDPAARKAIQEILNYLDLQSKK